MPDERVCQGYRVIDSIRVDNAEIVLAHNPNAPQPYVTWKCFSSTQFRDFETGCYFSDEADARKNMRKRADILREHLPPNHPDKKPQHIKKPHGRGR